MTGRDLAEYRRKRRAGSTPEPIPTAPPAHAVDGRRFVVQEHHARALHWDFRLERDGVLVSWAVPKGIPQDTRRNHLAVQTEDHPLEYLDFHGTIAAGEYGGGTVSIWDRGTYQLEEWSDREVKVVLNGDRTQGRFVLIHTGGKNWIMHRMDAPAHPDWVPPRRVAPMLATPGSLPPASQDRQWAFEVKWDGVRAICEIDGGRITLWSRNDRDITVSYPEVRGLGAQLGTTQAVLDGELAVLDQDQRSSFSRLQPRMHVASASEARRLADQDPVVYLIFDLLYLDGRWLLELPYSDRRQLLDGLELEGAHWRTPPVLRGSGAAAQDAIAAIVEDNEQRFGSITSRAPQSLRRVHRAAVADERDDPALVAQSERRPLPACCNPARRRGRRSSGPARSSSDPGRGRRWRRNRWR